MVSSQPQSPVAAVRILQKPSIGERGTRKERTMMVNHFQKTRDRRKGRLLSPGFKVVTKHNNSKMWNKTRKFHRLVRLPYVAKEEERSGTFGQPSASSKSQNKVIRVNRSPVCNSCHYCCSNRVHSFGGCFLSCSQR